jgi:hypothetical protein
LFLGCLGIHFYVLDGTSRINVACWVLFGFSGNKLARDLKALPFSELHGLHCQDPPFSKTPFPKSDCFGLSLKLDDYISMTLKI